MCQGRNSATKAATPHHPIKLAASCVEGNNSPAGRMKSVDESAWNQGKGLRSLCEKGKKISGFSSGTVLADATSP